MKRKQIMVAATVGSFLIALATTTTALAAPDLTYRGTGGQITTQHERISFQATLPALKCGATGEAPNICRTGGMVQARGPEHLNGLQRYQCIVRYRYAPKEGAGVQISFKREDTTILPGHPVQTGVSPPEKTRQSRTELPFNKPLQQEEVIHIRGTATFHGSVLLINGRGEVNLGEGAPLILPEHVRQVELDTLVCQQE